MSDTMMLDLAASGTPEDLDAIEVLLAPLECGHEGGHFQVSRSAKAVKVSAGGVGGLPVGEMFAALNNWVSDPCNVERDPWDVKRDYIALVSHPDDATVVRPDGNQSIPVTGVMEWAYNEDAEPTSEERLFASLRDVMRLV